MIKEKELINSKIMIVDDEQFNVHVLERILRENGFFNLQSTTDSRMAKESYKKFKPDIVLLDLNMPYLDGFQVMEQLNEIEKESYVPILVLTAQSEPETQLRALNEGAKDFIGKPFHIAEVLFRIRNILEVRLLYNLIKSQNTTLEEQVKERTKGLEMLNQEMKDMLFISSHHLQEPLRRFSSFGKQLENHNHGFDKMGLFYFKRMQAASQRLQDLMADFLQYSKVISSAKNQLEPVNLKLIIQEILLDLENLFKETKGRLEIGPLPNIDAYPNLMRDLFQNLITNSLKFHKKGVPPFIKVEGKVSSAQSGFIEIRVEDNGIGIEEKYIDRIFRPFERLHGDNDYEGTGIGLAICKKITECHEGSIEVRSNINQGTIFLIKLPIQHT